MPFLIVLPLLPPGKASAKTPRKQYIKLLLHCAHVTFYLDFCSKIAPRLRCLKENKGKGKAGGKCSSSSSSSRPLIMHAVCVEAKTESLSPIRGPSAIIPIHKPL